jgi:DNA polymerase-3 subunit delta'
MRFADIIGNAEVARALVSMADSGRVAHAVLMYENEGCGALALALAYVQYLNCSNPVGGDSCGECPSCRQMAKLVHPDVHYVFPVNKGPKTTDDKPVSESYIKYWRELAIANPYFTEADLQRAIGIESKNGLIAVAEAKSLISKLSLTAVADGYKAVIFYLPEKMNQETANRLLKLVEEPPEKTLFIFITHGPEKVLQTIFSRCQSIRVMPLTKEEKERVKAMNPFDDSEDYNLFMDLFSDLMRAVTGGDLMAALECGEAISALESREKQKAFCNFAGGCIRKIFMIQQNMPQIAEVDGQELEFYTDAAQRCPKGFCLKAVANIEKVVAMIDRNVSSKILFCDLVNRMYLSVWPR